MTSKCEAAGDDRFWFGKRVLITGGDGFVAANMAVELLRRNANVTLVVRHHRPVSTMEMLGDEPDTGPTWSTPTS